MFMELIQKRRSIRQYRSEPVEKEKVATLLEAALRAPSSRGFNPWEFVVVTDKKLLETLAGAKPHGAGFLKNAPLGIVVCADPEKCDVWVEDASIAAIFIQLAAESMGLCSCWIQIRKRSHADGRTSDEYVKEVLGISAHLQVASFVAIGYPQERKPGHSFDTLLFEKIHYNKYGNRQV